MRHRAIYIPKKVREELELVEGSAIFVEITKRHPITEKTLKSLEEKGIPTSRKLYAL